jgi:hypothetical protein
VRVLNSLNMACQGVCREVLYSEPTNLIGFWCIAQCPANYVTAEGEHKVLFVQHPVHPGQFIDADVQAGLFMHLAYYRFPGRLLRLYSSPRKIPHVQISAVAEQYLCLHVVDQSECA